MTERCHSFNWQYRCRRDLDHGGDHIFYHDSGEYTYAKNYNRSGDRMGMRTLTLNELWAEFPEAAVEADRVLGHLTISEWRYWDLESFGLYAVVEDPPGAREPGRSGLCIDWKAREGRFNAPIGAWLLDPNDARHRP